MLMPLNVSAERAASVKSFRYRKGGEEDGDGSEGEKKQKKQNGNLRYKNPDL